MNFFCFLSHSEKLNKSLTSQGILIFNRHLTNKGKVLSLSSTCYIWLCDWSCITLWSRIVPPKCIQLNEIFKKNWSPKNSPGSFFLNLRSVLSLHALIMFAESDERFVFLHARLVLQSLIGNRADFRILDDQSKFDISLNAASFSSPTASIPRF